METRRRPFPAALTFSTGKLGCEDVLWCFPVAELQGPTSSFGGVRKPWRGRQQLNPVLQCHTGFVSVERDLSWQWWGLWE